MGSDALRNATDGAVRRPLPVLRWLLAASAVLSCGAGASLFLLTEQTDRYFAWTIAVPLTAATLGAGFWSGMTLVVLALRERAWATMRVGLPGVLVFTVGMLAATLIHLDLFHTDALTGIVWVAVYVALPPVLLAMLLLQLRAPGADPARERPLPPWLRVALLVPALVLLVVGIGLFVAPATFDAAWPWPQKPLPARALGTGLAALGTILVQMAWENDLDRDRTAFGALAVLGILQLIAVLRYSDTIDWDTSQAWVYAAGIAGAIVLGLYGCWLVVRGAPAADASRLAA